MKKIIQLLIAAVLLASLCGCSETKDDENVRGEVLSQTSDVQSEEPQFSLGKATNNTYKNDFLGISCTLSSEWVFYTDEQIKELNSIAADYADDEVEDALKNASVIQDMFVQNSTNNSNINITLEKLNAAQLISLDIKKSLENQIAGVKSTYENMGYTNVNVTYQKSEVGGKEYDGISIVADINGYTFYAKSICFRKSNYLANITACAIGSDNTNEFLNYFKFE